MHALVPPGLITPGGKVLLVNVHVLDLKALDGSTIVAARARVWLARGQPQVHAELRAWHIRRGCIWELPLWCRFIVSFWSDPC